MSFDANVLIEYTGDTLRGVARRLAIDPAVLCRPLTPNQADRYANKLGVHPSEIWGARWWRDPTQRVRKGK